LSLEPPPRFTRLPPGSCEDPKQGVRLGVSSTGVDPVLEGEELSGEYCCRLLVVANERLGSAAVMLG